MINFQIFKKLFEQIVLHRLPIHPTSCSTVVDVLHAYEEMQASFHPLASCSFIHAIMSLSHTRKLYSVSS